MKCELVEPDLDPENPPSPIHNGLSGTQVSSLYKLKDLYGHVGAFFAFGDIAVTRQGKFRLKFTLYERPFSAVANGFLPEYVERSALFSAVFTVFPARSYPGLEQSTPKTQGFVEQGVRLRIRKESLAAGSRKRNMSIMSGGSPPDGPVASRGDAMRRRIAFSSAQLGGETTLALAASPTQLVPSQVFPLSPQHTANPQQHHPQLQQQQQHHHLGGHAAASSHDASGAGYMWTPELQNMAPFWSGSPIASAPPSWPGNPLHQHQHHQHQHHHQGQPPPRH